MPELQTLRLDTVPDLLASPELRTANNAQDTQRHRAALSGSMPQADNYDQDTATRRPWVIYSKVGRPDL